MVTAQSPCPAVEAEGRMQPLNLVLFQSDAKVAQSLVSALSDSCASVRQVESFGDLRRSMAINRASVAILDLEAASMADVERLSLEFPATCIVCTHRLADEDMWTAAVNAGAADVCPPTDTRGILRTALRNISISQSAAA
jgi:DNA-binding NtrC family response regulator